MKSRPKNDLSALSRESQLVMFEIRAPIPVSVRLLALSTRPMSVHDNAVWKRGGPTVATNVCALDYDKTTEAMNFISIYQ